MAQGNTRTNVVSTAINEWHRQIKTTDGTTQSTLVSFGSQDEAGQYVAANVKYLRITNLDDSVSVDLSLYNTGGTPDEYAYIVLHPGHSFMLGSAAASFSAVATATTTLIDITTIAAKARSGSVDLELVIALV
tara:strand:- start:2147 stop:2545 length:399 start_codon:yes stop_codon:yes gene_type:complete